MFARVSVLLFLSAFLLGAAPTVSEGGAVSVANALIENCPENLKTDLLHPFDDPGRLDWHYFPRDREGLAIGSMDDEQKDRLWTLMKTALSQKGMDKVEGVIRLEQVLFDRDQSPGRDPGNFHLSIWGDPSEGKEWTWRFEGHHMSVNVTLNGDQAISVTPTFFGANPGTVDEGKWKGFRNLPTQEDLAREFMLSLPKNLREQAIVGGELTDVESAGSPQVDPEIDTGLAGAELNESGRALLEEMLQTYSEWFLPEISKDLGLDSTSLVNNSGLMIQWKGGLGEGDDLHTYRVSGETFDIQYANNQNSANHVHTLIRTVGHDFGE